MADVNDTPAMRQYFHFKKQHPECVLFFRIGDFYEMFHDDARLANRVLGVTLTQRTEVLKKRPQVEKEFLPDDGQPEGTPFEKLGADILLQLPHLPAHRRLLNTIGNMPHRRADSAVCAYIVE